MSEQAASAETRLLMAAMIMAIRTARLESNEFNGAMSPRSMAQVATSLKLADVIYKRALEEHPDWFEALPLRR